MEAKFWEEVEEGVTKKMSQSCIGLAIALLLGAISV